MYSGVPEVDAAAAALAEAAAGNLEAESPPKRGPLANIDKWGKPLVESWVKGIDAQRSKVAGAGVRLAQALVPRPELASALAGGGSVRGGPNVHYHVDTMVASDRSLDRFEDRMARRRKARGRGPMRYGDSD
jgi:hypothetical protein